MERGTMEGIPRELRLAAALHRGSYAEKKQHLKGLVDRQAVVRREAHHPEGLVLIGDGDYPEGLYRLSDPPFALYVQGDRALLKRPGVALVGARRCSPYGRRVAECFAAQAAAIGALVVSGGALGIDAAAHETALRCGGRTVAVLGGGLEVPYPAQHRHLFQRIGTEGVLVSEYPPHFKPQRWTFPMRNRIIAALSKTVLVVEASERSGALHTATHGVDCGCGVQAVPGGIFSEGFRGNHELLSMGVELVFDPKRWGEDFLRAYPQGLRNRLADLSLVNRWMTGGDLERIFQLPVEVLERLFYPLQPSMVLKGDSGGRYMVQTNFDISKCMV